MFGLCLLAFGLAAPIPKGEREGTILLVRSSPLPAELIVMRSGGNIEKRFEPKGIEGRITAVRLSPSATKALLICQITVQVQAAGGRVWPPVSCYLIDLEKPDEPAKLVYDRLTYALRATWAPDGKSIYVSDLDPEKVNAAIAAKPDDPLPYRSWAIDLGTLKKEPLKLPAGHIIYDISNDGKTLLTGTMPNITKTTDYQKMRGYLVPRDTLVPKLLLDSEFSPTKLSPDGSRALGYRRHMDEAGRSRIQYIVIDKDGTNETLVREPPAAMSMMATPTFANNGRSVAFVWYERVDRPDGQGQTIRYNLSVADRTGSNMKVIYKTEANQSVSIFDWR
jgi:hypothetical protein